MNRCRFKARVIPPDIFKAPHLENNLNSDWPSAGILNREVQNGILVLRLGVYSRTCQPIHLDIEDFLVWVGSRIRQPHLELSCALGYLAELSLVGELKRAVLRMRRVLSVLAARHPIRHHKKRNRQKRYKPPESNAHG